MANSLKQHLSALSITAFVTLVCGCGSSQFSLSHSADSEDVSSGLRGHYGFLSDFSAMSETSARERIRTMTQQFGIKEFQFYDWFADYETPTDGDCWVDAFSRRHQICLTTIKVYIDEVHRQGGRAWAYVQAIGAERSDLADDNAGVYRLIDQSGRWYWHANRFPTYFANSAWANRMAEIWAPAVAQLGFDGIHWDTLGALAGDYEAERSGIHQFLFTAKRYLAEHNLLQTINMVNLAWWDEAAIKDTVSFPYAETWSMGIERKYYDQVSVGRGLGGVIAFYPTIDRPIGWSDSQTMLARWDEAQRHGLSYLVIGDGDKRLINEYFLNNTRLTPDEIRHLATTSVHE